MTRQRPKLMLTRRWFLSILALWAFSSVHAEEPAPRIVSLAPHLTELAFVAGVGDRLVGVVEWSDHPEAARRLPRIGDAFRFDLEAIVRLGTSDALAWQDGTPAAAIEALEDIGIRVHSISTRSLSGIADALRQIGQLGGRPESGTAAARDFRNTLEVFSAVQRQRLRGDRIGVLYQVSERPLFTLGGNHVINEIFELCGAFNVFGEVNAAAITIDLEAALARQPLAIVAGDAAPDSTALDLWRHSGGTPASRCGHLLLIDPDLLVRPTPRILDGAQRLCRWLDQQVRADPRPDCRP